MRRPTDFTAGDWMFLAVAVVVAAFTGLGAHDLAIAHLGVPYPHEDAVPVWARYLGQVVRIAALVAICRLGGWFLGRWSALGAAAIVASVIVMQQETIRLIVINIAIVDGFADGRWWYAVVDAVPGAVYCIFIGAAAAWVARWLCPDKRIDLKTWGAVAIIAAFWQFALAPALQAGDAALKHALRLVEPDAHYQMPFGIHMYRFIYITAIEPALATGFVAFLVWPSLRPGAVRRVIAFVLLILLVRGRVVATGLFSWWVPQPPLIAVAAEGQFFAETLLMALIVGVAWTIVTRPLKDARTN